MFGKSPFLERESERMVSLWQTVFAELEGEYRQRDMIDWVTLKKWLGTKLPSEQVFLFIRAYSEALRALFSEEHAASSAMRDNFDAWCSHMGWMDPVQALLAREEENEIRSAAVFYDGGRSPQTYFSFTETPEGWKSKFKNTDENYSRKRKQPATPSEVQEEFQFGKKL